MKRFFTWVAAVGLAHAAMAAPIPLLINLQGRLTDANGNPIKSATQVDFGVFQGGTAGHADEGTALYRERAIVTPTSDGTYEHLIGSGTSLDGRPLTTAGFDAGQDMYLQMTVGGSVLLPRIRFVAGSYAFVADRANLAHVAESVQPAAISSDSFKTGSVTSDAILDGTIQSVDLGAGSVALPNLGSDVTAKLIPSGLIALFDGACPAGWTRFAALDDRFPLGASSYTGSPGGSAAITGLATAPSGAHSHTVNPHTHTAGTLSADGSANFYNGGAGATDTWVWNHVAAFPVSGETGASSPGTDIQGTHVHAITSDGSWRPPYLGVVFCRKD